MPRDELPTLPLRSQAAWEAWLAKHHATSPGLYLKLAKKESGIASVTYPEALESALCFGWIDGLKLPFDERYWLQRFTPRRPRSKWSRINCDKVAALEKAGKLRPAGLREVAAARKDGRWDAAYPGARAATVPADLEAALERKPKAKSNFEKLSGSLRYRILYYIHDAKQPETRARRIAQFVAKLASGASFR
jgi:uncharacterized protein YdeI (YjbR/CyaY-like superfamily)